jgi:hypothetical protein
MCKVAATFCRTLSIAFGGSLTRSMRKRKVRVAEEQETCKWRVRIVVPMMMVVVVVMMMMSYRAQYVCLGRRRSLGGVLT